MKIKWKILIASIVFLLIAIPIGCVLFARWQAKIQGVLQSTPLIKSFQPLQQKTFSFKKYSDPAMNLSFNYPTAMQLSQVRPHLISLKNLSSTSSDNSLYIYEATLSKNAKTVDIPFVIKGTLQKQTPFTLRDFSAKQLVYSDGINYLTLRKNQQFIMMRIPKDSAGVADTITDFVNTVKQLQ